MNSETLYRIRVHSGSRHHDWTERGTYEHIRRKVTAQYPASAIWSIQPVSEMKRTTPRVTDRGHVPADYTQAMLIKRDIEADVRDASDAMQRYPRQANGLYSDETRASLDWQDDKARYSRAFALQRAYNEAFLRLHGVQYREERKKAQISR